MPNKYNFPQFNIDFTPVNAKTNMNKTVLNIKNEQKKEPVMQISDENDTQVLYYLDNILLYKFNNVNFFVICLTSDKNPETYIVFDITGGGTTHDGSSIAKILLALAAANQNSGQNVSLDFNADLRNRTFLRTGNVFYAGNITTSRVFPMVSAISPTNLPVELKELTSVPIGADPVVFVQEEIQWVLDCNQIGEYGKEVPIMESKNPYGDIIIGIMGGTFLAIVVGYLIYEFIKRMDTRTSMQGTSSSFTEIFSPIFTKAKAGIVKIGTSMAETSSNLVKTSSNLNISNSGPGTGAVSNKLTNFSNLFKSSKTKKVLPDSTPQPNVQLP